MQKETVASELISKHPVMLRISVGRIANERVEDMFEVAAQLMPSTRRRSRFNQ